MKRIAMGFVDRWALTCLTFGAVLGLLVGGVGCAAPKRETAGPITEVPAQSFVRAWTLDFTSSKARVEWMREAGDFLILFTTDRQAKVIRKSSGSLVTIHQIDSSGPVLAPFTDGNVIAYPVSTYIEVHDLTGKLVRKIDLNQAAQSTGVAYNGTIYIAVSGENGGRLRAVSPTREYGTPVWELLAFGAIKSAPVVQDSVIYFVTIDGHVYAVTETRKAIWALDKGFFRAGPVQADLTVDKDGLYVASTDTKLICLDPVSGRVKWQHYAGEPLFNKPIATAENVYLMARNEGLISLDKLDGQYNRRARWTNHEASKFLSEDGSFVYVAMKNRALAALDKGTGAVAFRSGVTDLRHFISNPGTDGMIYAATENGRVLGIRPVARPGTVGEVLYTPVGK